MPKKKVQHKGKPKHCSEDSQDYVYEKKDIENKEEEYTTVVDYEAKRKYSKRPIESNWSRYEREVLDTQLEVEENETPETSDLNYLIETASSDCSHFEFSFEKMWKSENNSVPSSKIFNLDLNILSKGLACVPFHERMGLDESELSAEDKEKFLRDAENGWKEYKEIREKSIKSEEDSRSKDLEDKVETLVESVKDKLGLGVGSGENEKDNECIKVCEVENGEKVLEKTTALETECSPKVEKNKQSLFFSEKDENLEDWLDSVLDD